MKGARTVTLVSTIMLFAHWSEFRARSAEDTVIHAQQAPVARPTCMALLTDAEVYKTLGRTGAKTEKKETVAGDTSCNWQWEDSLTVLTVTFVDVGAIKAIASHTKCCPAASVQQFFDHYLRVQQNIGAPPPQPMSGIGQRAAFFDDGASLQLVIQRPDGVVTIMGFNVGKDRMLGLGRAIVAP